MLKFVEAKKRGRGWTVRLSQGSPPMLRRCWEQNMLKKTWRSCGKLEGWGVW